MLPALVTTLPEKNTQQDSDFFNTRSPEMFINMKPSDIPPFKHPDRIEFVKNELRKCKEGVNINGTLIPPNLYYHLNFHSIPVDELDHTGKVIRVITKPLLRDNDWIIHNDYYQAWKQKKAFIVAGSRQLGKTISLVSLACRELFCYDNAEVMGLFSISADKDTFNKYLQIALSDKSNFLIIPNIDKDLTQTEIRFGLTRKNNEPIVLSRLYTYLTKAGKATEVGAGKSLSFFFFDELAKEPVREVWEAVKPALVSPFGFRCSPFMSFTGGNVEKSQDAINMFTNPDANNVLSFETESIKTGKFMGGWYRQDFKYKTTLAEYLNKPVEGELATIDILVTDFEKANTILDQEQDDARKDKDPNALVKHKMYYPRSLKEMSLSAKESPFKTLEEALRKQQDFLYESKPGRKVKLFKYDGAVHAQDVDTADIYNFPHNASDNLDAPIIVYEEPTAKNTYKLYIAGMDPYNLTLSNNSPSLGAFYLMKRAYGSLNDPFQDTMVCKYVARPTDTINTYLENVQLILEWYKATMLYEVSNDNVLPFFDKQHKAEEFLANAWTLQRTINPKSSTLNSYGLAATTKNQTFWMNCIIEYLNEVVGVDQHGNPILGVSRILDPILIQEMLNWKEDLNVDRIVGFGHMIAYREHLDKFEKPQIPQQEEEEQVTIRYKKRNPWGIGSKSN